MIFFVFACEEIKTVIIIIFIKKVRTGQIEPLYSAIIGTNNTEVNHGYDLRYGGVKAYKHVPNCKYSTKRFSEFVTSKYL